MTTTTITQTEPTWHRLDPKVIIVDVVRVILSLTPAAVAFLLLDIEITLYSVGPVVAIAGWGLLSSTHDVIRWLTTRYRVTDDYVERRTGLVLRRYRSIRRDRIRSVDADALLRHRLAGLRRVTIGAGQQNTAFEAALDLDAVSTHAATQLRHELLGADAPVSDTPHDDTAPSGHTDTPQNVLADIRYRWIVFNLFNVWAYFSAIGILFAVYALAFTFGVNLWTVTRDALDWNALGWGWGTLLVLAATGAVGVLGLAFSFVSTYWNFRLTRTRTGERAVIRTTQGLFRTREINRAEHRLRGVQISEPVLWRWMGIADTTVITTGLSIFTEAATILPRGPMSTARPVAHAVLDHEIDPMGVALPRHPRAALTRRLLWALTLTAATAAITAWLGATTSLSATAWIWVTALLGPLSLLLAVVAYRALGHAVVHRWLVTRSGMVARATSVLRRDAISGVALRQSVLQRRLGLTTMSVTCAAGLGVYEAPDLAEEDSVGVALAAAPSILEEFLEPQPTKSTM
ncbi:PH domain-containing protein [Spiractinospora alimapuensis]|uniref:PH domain-containing protein n=1 Tax=Spiractinospora alimapuensis TaxID=2820884 RepID=UPI001F3C448C|nr:PH domain-containing protein [Spiractinospora alimapuensis]QVQ52562.1 PH domain-containing protein [Spiractinospora alimapuensis]